MDCVVDFFTFTGIKTALLLNGFKDVSKSTRSTLERLDPLTLTLLQTIIPKIEKANLDLPTDEDIRTEEVDLGWKKNGTQFDA